MESGTRSLRRSVVLLLLVAAVVGTLLARRGLAPRSDRPDAAQTPPVVATAPPELPAAAPAPVPDATLPPAEPLPDPTPAFPSIDLEAARAALPDNLYWETAAPSQDPRLLGERERAKTYWNEQYGKVLSGTGSREEIEAFFHHRMRVSSDYVRFVDYVLERQGHELSEQDLELLHVARRLHLARLEEVPRRMQEALDRRAEQDAAREAWLADQRALEAEGGAPAADGVPADGVE